MRSFNILKIKYATNNAAVAIKKYLGCNRSLTYEKLPFSLRAKQNLWYLDPFLAGINR